MNEENQNVNNEENIQIVQPNNNEMNNQAYNEKQETKNSSKTTNVLLVIFIIISLLLAGYIVYDKTSTKEEHKEPIPVPEKDNAGEEKNEIDPKLYVGAYGGKRLVSDSDGEQESYNDILYLREDGSFYLVIGDQVCGTNLSGTYKIDSKTLTLEQTVSYGCDACFFKESKVYTANIEDAETIKLSYEGETLELKKGIVEAEDSNTLVWYVPNPVDGVTPEGWGEPWGDCTGR